jgi:hypothetical protein
MSPHCFQRLRSDAELAVRQSPPGKDLNTESQETAALEAVTKRQQAKIQQTEKS